MHPPRLIRTVMNLIGVGVFASCLFLLGCKGNAPESPSAPETKPETIQRPPVVEMTPLQKNAYNLERIARAIQLFGHDGNFHGRAFLQDKFHANWRYPLITSLTNSESVPEFNFEEDWDGPTNKKLAMENMPDVFKHPARASAPGMTYYQIVVGPDCIMGNRKMPEQMADTAAATIIVVEVDEPVFWTDPAVIEFDQVKPAIMGKHFPVGFAVVFGDGTARYLPRDIAEADLKAFLTMNGGEKVQVNQIDPKIPAPRAMFAASEEGLKQESASKLHEIVLAMNNFELSFGRLPRAPWRWEMREFIDGGAINHPKGPAPDLLQSPGRTVPRHLTPYCCFVGTKAGFCEGNWRVQSKEFLDKKRTLLLVEAGESAAWYGYADLPYDPAFKLPPLGGLFDDGFHAAFADGSVRWIPRDTDEQVLRALIAWRDAKPVDVEQFKKVWPK